jgi:uncharacterized membrane protein YdjX (TVP38/TMEM64 family)
VRTVILGATLAVIVLLFYELDLFRLFSERDRLIRLIEQHRAYAVFIFLGLQVIQVIVVILPGEVTGFAGGILFGPLWGIVLSTLGLTLGSWITFNLARHVGRPLVEVLVSRDTINRYDYVLKHKGIFLVFLMFLAPGFPKDLLCYLLGLGHMRQADFLIVSTAGRLFGTTLLTIGGSFFRDGRYGAFLTFASIGLGVILVALIYREKIERWFRTIHAARDLRSAQKRSHRKEKDRDDERTDGPDATHD